MTSQLGRFRQWAGEVMASKENKMFVSDELRDLEAEIDLRKEGIGSIQYASEAYHRSLSKKKQYEGLENKEKLMPLDALGLVMIVHGEKFGESSAFGSALVKSGRAHCKVATLQEAYAVTFKDTFVSSLQDCLDGIKEYEHLNKKLESRRSAYESAHYKVEKLKQSKKEKERLEAEEELEKAKQRFDETAEDIRAHTELIRNDDSLHLRQLGSFLDLEINFVQQYLELLQEIKSDWSDVNSSPTTTFKRSIPSPRPISRRSSGKDSSPTSTNSSPNSFDDDINSRTSSNRRRSSRGESGGGSKPPSRPTSRLSRKRTNSNATATSDKDREASSVQYSTRRSVAGWASSAVESVTNRRKKDKENFATLDDEDEEGSTGRRSLEWASSLKKSPSIGSTGRRSPYFSSPKVTPQASKVGVGLGKRVVRARSDYEATSSNELSFQAGNEIVVLNEVLDSWWMGELNNRRGLFPTTHIETIDPSNSRPLPPSQAEKPISPGLIANNSLQAPRDSDTHSLDDGYGTSELVEERDLTSRPMEHSPFIEGLGDTHSIASITTDDEDHSATIRTPKQSARVLDSSTPKHTRSASSSPPEPALLSAAGYLGRDPSSLTPTLQTPAKKIPPPPPPRRLISNTPVIAPPLPERRTNVSSGSIRGYASSSSTASSASSLLSATGTGSSGSGEGYDKSPFESTLDLSAPTGQQPGRSSVGTDGTNPFRRG